MQDPVSAALGSRPGAIVAVHVNYPSRAAQRGRTPAHPSYFLKPVSSLSATEQPLVRPQGCELLGFEGEIAPGHRSYDPSRHARAGLGGCTLGDRRQRCGRLRHEVRRPRFERPIQRR